MSEILAQAAVAAVERVSWSPTTINLIIGGTVVVIGALSAGIVAVIRAMSDMRKVVVETRDLADGHYSLVLTELASVKKLLADATGAPGDRAAAVHAEGAAKAQQAVVDKVNGKAH